MAELEATLDYETRSTIPLDKAGAIVYAKHPSTSIFCLGYKIGDGPCKLWIPERAPMPHDLWQAFQRGTLVAQNAAFERAITRWTLPRYPLLTDKQREVLRNLSPSRWRCTAAKAAACSLPRRLEWAAKALNLPTLKDEHGHKLIKKYSKPRKPSKHNPKCWWDNHYDLRDIYRYCLTDVQAEWELDQALPDLSDFEQKVWELDQKINDRGILIDIPTVKIILGMISEEMRNVTARVQKLSNGTIDSGAQVGKLFQWVNARGADLPDLKAPTIKDALARDDLDPRVRKMLEYRQASSRTSTGKYIAMLHAVGEDHRARELLLYNGTTPTARWSGKRIQPQNFPRPTLKDFNSDEAIEIIKKGGLPAIRKKYGEHKVMDVLVSCVRGMLIASEGHELFCSDWAAVEARIAFWVTEHHEGLRAFIENRKLYEEMASEAFGIPVDEVEKDSLERFVGKESVLGCQYGLGWAKFLKNCLQKGMKQVTAKIAKQAVYTYRKVHWPVPKFWADIENACIQAVLNPGKRYRVTKVVAYVSGDWLNIKLPSGRRLRYYKPSVRQKQLRDGRMAPQLYYFSMEKIGWMEIGTWGGTLTNHIVQGIARDLMAHGMINIEEAGYRFLLSIHDEGLAEHKKGLGSVKEYVKLYTKIPEWAEGLPLKAEGWSGPRYHK